LIEPNSIAADHAATISAANSRLIDADGDSSGILAPSLLEDKFIMPGKIEMPK
jgi:hypothetical protein